MTEHADVTGQDILSLQRRIRNFDFSSDTLELLNKHLYKSYKGHRLWPNTDEAVVQKARHLQAISRGELSASDLEPQR